MRFKRTIGVLTGVLSTLMLSTTVYAGTSELTGLDIDDSIKDQRPIAVMVDNEKIALDHYGTSEADIVYEMMNSTANGRITRLMCIYKDWADLKQTGSIRSARTTNVVMSGEYNAVLIHDGGPYYINSYLKKSYATNISGGFSRIKNGKPTEYTEYVFGPELVSRFEKGKVSTSYTATPERESHFLFYEGDSDLAGGAAAGTIDMESIFTHNKSNLVYNADTKTYDYYEYGSIHKDVEDDQALSFKNALILDVPFKQLDKNGYLNYKVIGTGKGYYATNGMCVPITWSKSSETEFTHYYDAAGNEININKGKTYIGFIPSDAWDKLKIS